MKQDRERLNFLMEVFIRQSIKTGRGGGGGGGGGGVS